jgi:hypothetical protein
MKDDLEILDWIHNLGYCDIEQAFIKFGEKSIKLLLTKELLLINTSLSKFRLVYLAPSAVDMINNKLRPVKNIGLSKVNHNILMNELIVKLEDIYNINFITERKFRNSLPKGGFAVCGHIPDGIININGKSIAVELELSSKGSLRRKSIVDFYLSNIDYDEVWYFYKTTAIRNEIYKISYRMKFINLIDLKNFNINC